MSQLTRLTRKSSLRAAYKLHKEQRHRGNSEFACSLCAEFEYELIQNPLRRDSE